MSWFFNAWARTIARPHEEDEVPLIGDIDTVQGFVVWPGRRCEGAIFALLRRAAADGSRAEWFWHCCCETQYASVVSDDHLIFCHTSLVAVLDHAIECGWDVVVRDEGHYWETRDTNRLLQEVEYMNRLVARIAGGMSDALSGGHSVGGAIFDHPEFEHLEVERNPRPGES